MAATPYPTDYVYAGNAVVLTLKTAVSDGGGDLTLTVNEETSTKGWPSLGAGQRLVIVVGRGTAYETKYAVKTITSSASGSTLVVDSADKTFDNTPVTAAPAGTVVEHCWSATEASLANDHMRTKQAHGSDGDLVDQNSAQLLSNKTVMTPTASGHPTTKSYVDAADALALPKAGGTMTGKITLDGDPSAALHAAPKQYVDAMLPKAGGTMSGNVAMGGNKVTGLAAASSNGDAVRYEQLTSLGVYSAWTPTLTASSSNPTASATASENRYTQTGKRVSGWGHMNVTAAGGGTYRLPLPVAPRSTSAAYKPIGWVTLIVDSGGTYARSYRLVQVASQTYCHAIDFDSSAVPSINMLSNIDVSDIDGRGGSVYLTWQFDYEAA